MYHVNNHMNLQKYSYFEITNRHTDTLQLSIISCHKMPYYDLFIKHMESPTLLQQMELNIFVVRCTYAYILLFLHPK